MWFGSAYALYYLNESGIMATLPQWQQYAAAIISWQISGFFMWGIFVVGHDCGHGTFSDNWLLNDIIGHICHGSIMVPYYPWQLSHRRHHMYHNHVDKDYSHPWYTEERLGQTDEGLYRFFREHKDLMATFPLFGWTAYLLGSPDGS